MCSIGPPSLFHLINAKIQRTLVWVRFPGLNLPYYNENVLMGLASVIGKPIRVDRNTLNVERGHFAHVCIEIDLSQPVVGKYFLDWITNGTEWNTKVCT